MRGTLTLCALLVCAGCGSDEGDDGKKPNTDSGVGGSSGGSGGSGAVGGSGGSGGTPDSGTGGSAGSTGGSAGSAGSAGAAGAGGDTFFSQSEWTLIQSLSPLPAVPADPTNAYADDANAAALGQMLFFDTSISGALVVGDDGTNGGLGAVGATGKVACASCHQSAAMDDSRSKPNNVSLGIDYGTRNALSIINSSYYAWTNWGGRFDSQWSLPVAVAENPKTMNGTRLQIAHLLWNKYKTEYDAIFPVALDPALDPAATDAARFPLVGKPKAAGAVDGPWELMTEDDRKIVNRIAANYGKAIQAYMRKLVSKESAFDEYVAGDFSAISAQAKQGLKVFIGTGQCLNCHSGPNFADDSFHALAVPQTGAHVPAADLGRFADVPPLLGSIFNTSGTYSDDTNTGKLTGLVQDASQTGKFRTKSLRGVADSAPYMHAGQHATLADVIAYYVAGGSDPGDSGVANELSPLALQTGDDAALVEFMKTLTGAAVPAPLLQDTSK